MGMEMKTCVTCKEAKPLDEFHKGRTHPQGRAPKCKPCKRAYDNARYAANRKGIRERQRVYNLMSRYGISEEEYEELLAAQGGACAICGATQGWMSSHDSGKPKRLAVDHSHESGKVRGLLCDRCNTVLGKTRDSPELLRKAAEYLLRHRNV